MQYLVAESAVERDDVRCGDKVNAGAQTSSDGEGFKSCHDRAARPATLLSLVYDNIDCEAVHRAVADEPPHPDGDAAIDRTNGSNAAR